MTNTARSIDSASTTSLKVSVAMAAFEVERFISRQLASILCQTVSPDEIIICDDSRNDGTYKTIKNLIKKGLNA